MSSDDLERYVEDQLRTNPEFRYAWDLALRWAWWPRLPRRRWWRR